MNDRNCLVNIEKISKEFEQPSSGPLRVLVEVSMKVMSGDAVALTGVNGSGKTTLLRIIAGELDASSGTVWLNNVDCTAMPAYERARFTGRVHQESYKSLASELTVEESLALAARRNAKLSIEFPRAAHAFDDLRFISPRAADYFSQRSKLVTRTLSGGQRQLLALIVGILGRPQVLLLDEHMASLDEAFRDLANDLLRSFVENAAGAFIAATHDKLWAQFNTTRIAKLDHGKVIIEANPAQGGRRE